MSWEWRYQRNAKKRRESEMQLMMQMQAEQARIQTFLLLNNDDAVTLSSYGDSEGTGATSTLVLFYDFKTVVGSSPGSSLSYTTGVTATDIQGNSDATLYNTPTFRDYYPGYMEFNGTNEYMINNDSLIEVPTDIVTISTWVYPRDNGVVLSERGTASLSSGWHDAQINMVGGTAKFGMWAEAGIVPITSSIPTPLKNWYHMAMSYDGTTLTAYVNGATAGSATFSRENPIENGVGLFYAIAGPDLTAMGDTTYESMKLGTFKVWNETKVYSDILAEYEERKGDYYAGAVNTSRVLNVDFYDYDSYPETGSTAFDLSTAGNNVTISGSPTINLYGGYMRLNGTSQYGTLTRPVADTFSLNCWFKTTQNAGVAGQWYQGMGLMDCEVSGSANDFGLSMGAGKILFGIGTADTTIASPLSYNDGNWHNACATRNRTTGIIKLYVDGVEVDNGTGNTASLTTATTMGIGRLQTALNYFSGDIGLCQAYNVELTDAQVLQNFNAYKTRYGL